MRKLLSKLNPFFGMTAEGKRKRQEARHRRGYNFAAGFLLRAKDKVKAINELEAWADNPFDRNEFDVGIESAVRDFQRLQA